MRYVVVYRTLVWRAGMLALYIVQTFVGYVVDKPRFIDCSISLNILNQLQRSISLNVIHRRDYDLLLAAL